MRDVRGLEEKVKNLLESIQISDEKLKHESLRVHSPRLAAFAVIPADAGIQKPDWLLLAEMTYRTHGCYRADQSVMSDEEFMKEF